MARCTPGPELGLVSPMCRISDLRENWLAVCPHFDVQSVEMPVPGARRAVEHARCSAVVPFPCFKDRKPVAAEVAGLQAEPRAESLPFLHFVRRFRFLVDRWLRPADAVKHSCVRGILPNLICFAKHGRVPDGRSPVNHFSAGIADSGAEFPRDCRLDVEIRHLPESRIGEQVISERFEPLREIIECHGPNGSVADGFLGGSSVAADPVVE